VYYQCVYINFYLYLFFATNSLLYLEEKGIKMLFSIIIIKSIINLIPRYYYSCSS